MTDLKVIIGAKIVKNSNNKEVFNVMFVNFYKCYRMQKSTANKMHLQLIVRYNIKISRMVH